MKVKIVTFRVTDEQHIILEDFIIKNKRADGEFKSFNTVCQTAIKEFITKYINKEMTGF
mgnify:CR=1 FL=1